MDGIASGRCPRLSDSPAPGSQTWGRPLTESFRLLIQNTTGALSALPDGNAADWSSTRVTHNEGSVSAGGLLPALVELCIAFQHRTRLGLSHLIVLWGRVVKRLGNRHGELGILPRQPLGAPRLMMRPPVDFHLAYAEPRTLPVIPRPERLGLRFDGRVVLSWLLSPGLLETPPQKVPVLPDELVVLHGLLPQLGQLLIRQADRF